MPGPLDLTRMLERLHGAFNNQFSAQHAAVVILPPLEVLTPSTTNASNTSAGQSFPAPPREESPSLRNGSRYIENATGLANNLIDPVSDEAIEMDPEISAWRLSTSHVPDSDSAAGTGPVSPIPRGDLFCHTEPFNYNQYMPTDEDAGLNVSQSEPGGGQYAWNDALDIADNELFGLIGPL